MSDDIGSSSIQGNMAKQDKQSKEGKKDITSKDEISYLEEELSTTKYNKKTQHHIGLVKAKIARLKDKEETRKKQGKKGLGYSVKKSGNATVAILGFPSVGKSTILNKITNADSRVGAYDFTTLTVVPGVLEYNETKIQVLDIPGILKGASSGKGRGKEVLSVVRGSEMVIIVVDALNPWQYEALLSEVYDTGIRINSKKPNVKITKTSKDGIRIGATVKLTWLDEETIKGIMKEFKINNADVLLREDITVDQFIDVIEGNKIYMPGLVVLNKVDLVSKERLDQIREQVKPDVEISANSGYNIDKLKEMIFRKLAFIRIYLKEINKKPDMEKPMILFDGATLNDMCVKIHQDFVKRFRYAKIWGKSVRFPGQKIVKLDHILKDQDIVEIHVY